MGSDGPIHVVAVVADSSSLADAAARVDGQVGSDPAAITVVCPNRSAGARLANLLAVRGREATLRVVDPFCRSAVATAVPALGVDRIVVDRALPFTASEVRGGRAWPSTNGGSPLGEGTGPGTGTSRLRQPAGWPQRLTLFALAFGFYLLLGDPTVFDAVTGATSALVVAILLSRVTFTGAPALRRTVPRVGRALRFVPFLLWEVVRANLALTVVLLDPRLPIDAGFETVRTDAGSDLERAVLANSITLTPGTLTVDVRGSTFVVHTLTAASREGLREGRLERAVRFVFAGQRDDTAERSGR